LKPSATLLSLILFSANAAFIYYWLFDTEEDFKHAEVQIRQQAFASAKKKVENDATPDPRLNPNLQKALKRTPQPSGKPSSSVASIPSKNPSEDFEEIFAQHVEGLEEGVRLWCRQTDVEVASFPARCVYRGNCFRCGESELIKPDSEEATPFCTSGELASKFDTECCPVGFSDAGYKCPDMQTCLSAESVPARGCSCGGSDDCHYAATANQPDCQCTH
jgi:hypothetical protein